jgi:hypothetical protein
MGIEANTVLRNEVPLLQGLKFDLVVHSPYRALAGLFKVCFVLGNNWLYFSQSFVKTAHHYRAVAGLFKVCVV